MMTDPLTWSPISLGRWSGTQVRVHFFLIVFVVFRLLNAAMAPNHPWQETSCSLGLVFVTLAVHYLGRAGMSPRLGGGTEESRPRPLGNRVGPAPSARSAGTPL